MKKINNVSVCLISKNNENTIKKTLDSIKEIFNEIILIDTGSTDNTIEITRKYTEKIFNYKWKNDFSSARNFAYKYVNTDWLFWIDTDEEFILFDFNKLNDLINSDKESLFINRFDFLPDNEKGISLRCRFLKNLEKNYFYGKIHEVPINIDKSKTYILNEDIAILNHYPILKGKPERNINILKDIIKNTDNILDNIDYSIYLIKETINTKEKEIIFSEMLEKIKKLKEDDIRNNTNFINFFNELILLYISKNNYLTALEYCNKSLYYFPNNIVVISMKAEIFYKLKDYKKSLELYNKIINLVNDNKYFKSSYIYESIKSYGTLYNIALCYKELFEFEKSIEYLSLSLEINPDFEPAIILLNKFINNCII